MQSEKHSTKLREKPCLNNMALLSWRVHLDKLFILGMCIGWLLLAFFIMLLAIPCIYKKSQVLIVSIFSLWSSFLSQVNKLNSEEGENLFIASIDMHAIHWLTDKTMEVKNCLLKKDLMIVRIVFTFMYLLTGKKILK